MVELALREVYQRSVGCGCWDGSVGWLTVGVVDEGSVDIEPDLWLVLVLREVAPMELLSAWNGA